MIQRVKYPLDIHRSKTYAPSNLKVHRHLISQIIPALLAIFVKGDYSDKVVGHALKSHPKWGARDRRLFAETVYDLVRWWRWYWFLAGLPDAESLDPDAITELKVWQVWTHYWLAQGHESPDFPECAGANKDDIERLRSKSVAPAVRASVPDWLYERGQSELGDAWPSILDEMNESADVFIRANTLRISRAELERRLADMQIETKQVPGLPDALRLTQRRNVTILPIFREGLFEVQDAASQMVAPLLQVEPGMTVVDACAGAGGKSMHLACLMRNRGRLISMDVHLRKLSELEMRMQRNGIRIIEPTLIKSPRTIESFANTADRLLLDVPCSGMGVLRRKPDTKWHLSPEELASLRTTQHEILSTYSRMAAPGGKLVYATCSIFPSENEQIVKQFLTTQNGAWELEQELHTLPGSEGFDGFYAARLARR